MRVLAIGAHPDDCEMYCGGTLAKYAKTGNDVFMVSVTNGEIGSQTLPPEEISAIRHEEGKAAAAVIGAEYIWMGYQDQRFLIDNDVRMSFIDLFRYVKPDVVIGHYPDHYSADHTLVGQIANDIAHLPTAPNIKSKYPCIHKAPVHYFMDSPAGMGFIPEEYVDITEYVQLKREMLLCHKTQDDWLKYHCGQSIINEAEIVGQFRGLQVNVPYAEGFIKVKAWPRSIAGTLLP